MCYLLSRPDLPIGYVGLSLGPQDPRGPPTNCGTRRGDFRYMISSTNIRQNLFYVLIFLEIHFYSPNQLPWWQRQCLPTSFHESQNDGWSSRILLCRYIQCTLAASCVCWFVSIVTYESGERTFGCSCFKCTCSKLKVVMQLRAICRTRRIILQ